MIIPRRKGLREIDSWRISIEMAVEDVLRPEHSHLATIEDVSFLRFPEKQIRPGDTEFYGWPTKQDVWSTMSHRDRMLPSIKIAKTVYFGDKKGLRYAAVVPWYRRVSRRAVKDAFSTTKLRTDVELPLWMSGEEIAEEYGYPATTCSPFVTSEELPTIGGIAVDEEIVCHEGLLDFMPPGRPEYSMQMTPQNMIGFLQADDLSVRTGKFHTGELWTTEGSSAGGGKYWEGWVKERDRTGYLYYGKTR